MSPQRKLLRIILLTLMLYLVSIAITWPARALFGQWLNTYAGHSLFLQRLTTGPDLLFLSDFLPNTPDLGNLPAILIPLVLIYLAVQIILSAGLFQALAFPDDAPARSLWRGIGRWGARFLGLFLLCLPFYALVTFILAAVAELADVLTPAGMPEMFPIYGALVKSGLLLVGVSVVQVVQLSARAVMVMRGTGIIAAVRLALGLGFRNQFRLLVTYLGVVTAGGVGYLVLSLLAYNTYALGPVPIVLLQGAIATQLAARVVVHDRVVRACRPAIYPLISAPVPEILK